MTELPSRMKASTKPRFDGLNTCPPRHRMAYLVRSENAAIAANSHHLWNVQWSPTGVDGTRRMSPMPLPVSMALAGHTIEPVWRNVITTCSNAQVRIAVAICGTLTWKPSAT
jgi:hypothetical protein